jgi:hypothetical protein
MAQKQENRQVLHECNELKEYKKNEFYMDLEIDRSDLLVFNTFTKSTPKEYRRKYTHMYCIPVKFCPFCGISF